MKKILFTLVLVFTCFITLTACNKKGPNFEVTIKTDTIDINNYNWSELLELSLDGVAITIDETNLSVMVSSKKNADGTYDCVVSYKINNETYSKTLKIRLVDPTVEPTIEPTPEPTVEPTVEPTAKPTIEPTLEPTVGPTIPGLRDMTSAEKEALILALNQEKYHNYTINDEINGYITNYADGYCYAEDFDGYYDYFKLVDNNWLLADYDSKSWVDSILLEDEDGSSVEWTSLEYMEYYAWTMHLDTLDITNFKFDPANNTYVLEGQYLNVLETFPCIYYDDATAVRLVINLANERIDYLDYTLKETKTNEEATGRISFTQFGENTITEEDAFNEGSGEDVTLYEDLVDATDLMKQELTTAINYDYTNMKAQDIIFNGNTVIAGNYYYNDYMYYENDEDMEGQKCFDYYKFSDGKYYIVNNGLWVETDGEEQITKEYIQNQIFMPNFKLIDVNKAKYSLNYHLYVFDINDFALAEIIPYYADLEELGIKTLQVALHITTNEDDSYYIDYGQLITNGTIPDYSYFYLNMGGYEITEDMALSGVSYEEYVPLKTYESLEDAYLDFYDATVEDTTNTLRAVVTVRVLAVSANRVIVTDGESLGYVFADEKLISEFNVGRVIELTADITNYYAKNINTPIIELVPVKVSNAVKEISYDVTPNAFTSTEFTAYATNKTEYEVKYISFKASIEKSGKYLNGTVNGLQGYIASLYMADGLTLDDAYLNMTIQIEGYTIGFSGGKYVCVLVTNVTFQEYSNEELKAAIIAELEKLTKTTISDDLVLPTSLQILTNKQYSITYKDEEDNVITKITYTKPEVEKEVSIFAYFKIDGADFDGEIFTFKMAKYDPDAPETMTVKIDFAALTNGNLASDITEQFGLDKNIFSATYTKGSNNVSNIKDNHFRFYQGDKIVITVAGYTIGTIKITSTAAGDAQYGVGYIKVSSNDVDGRPDTDGNTTDNTATFNVSSSEVKLTNTKQVRITEIVITLTKNA